MGSNSLLEGMDLGEIAGTCASQAKQPERRRPERILRRDADIPPDGIELGISDLVYSLKSLMWRQVGLERDGWSLNDAQEHISFWFDAVRRLAPAQPKAWELINMLTVAQLAAHGAEARHESRGVHFRTDYPDTTDPMHTIIRSNETSDHCVEGSLEHVQIGVVLTH